MLRIFFALSALSGGEKAYLQRTMLKHEAAAAALKLEGSALKLDRSWGARQPNPPLCSCSSRIVCLGERKTPDPSPEAATIRESARTALFEFFAGILGVGWGGTKVRAELDPSDNPIASRVGRSL